MMINYPFTRELFNQSLLMASLSHLNTCLYLRKYFRFLSDISLCIVFIVIIISFFLTTLIRKTICQQNEFAKKESVKKSFHVLNNANSVVKIWQIRAICLMKKIALRNLILYSLYIFVLRISIFKLFDYIRSKYLFQFFFEPL